MVIFYSLKLVNYYDLSLSTFLVLILATSLYCAGTILGSRIRSNSKTLFGRKKIWISESEFKKIYKRVILICSLLGGFSAAMSLLEIIRHYGVTFFLRIAEIYGYSKTGQFVVTKVSYIGSFVYIAILLAVIYFLNYGYDHILILPIVIAVMYPFISGTREVLVECIMLVIMPFLLLKKKTSVRIVDVKKQKRRKRILAITISGLALLVVFISGQRGSYIFKTSVGSYINPKFMEVVTKVPGLYQVYTYISSPVGVLNAYLENPTYGFGKNTLLPFSNFLNHFGFDIPTQRYQDYYSIPISLNVGTAVRELIEDYWMFAFIIIILIGIYVGRKYKSYQKQSNYHNSYVLCYVFMLVGLSWFVWILRSAVVLLGFLIGSVLSMYLDRYKIKGVDK